MHCLQQGMDTSRSIIQALYSRHTPVQRLGSKAFDMQPDIQGKAGCLASCAINKFRESLLHYSSPQWWHLGCCGVWGDSGLPGQR